jgi:hypothetical protein
VALVLGAPPLLEVKQGEARHEHRLGPDWLAGKRPHALALARGWQTAKSLGAWLHLRFRTRS